jgi:hypothetical protein
VSLALALGVLTLLSQPRTVAEPGQEPAPGDGAPPHRIV